MISTTLLVYIILICMFILQKVVKNAKFKTVYIDGGKLYTPTPYIKRVISSLQHKDFCHLRSNCFYFILFNVIAELYFGTNLTAAVICRCFVIYVIAYTIITRLVNRKLNINACEVARIENKQITYNTLNGMGFSGVLYSLEMAYMMMFLNSYSVLDEYSIYFWLVIIAISLHFVYELIPSIRFTEKINVEINVDHFTHMVGMIVGICVGIFWN